MHRNLFTLPLLPNPPCQYPSVSLVQGSLSSRLFQVCRSYCSSPSSFLLLRSYLCSWENGQLLHILLTGFHRSNPFLGMDSVDSTIIYPCTCSPAGSHKDRVRARFITFLIYYLVDIPTLPYIGQYISMNSCNLQQCITMSNS